MAQKVIVTGGCGFIGSHTITDLVAEGFEVISIDSMERADPRVLDGLEAITGKKIKNYQINLTDRLATLEVFKEHSDAVGVIHFAAYKSVSESVSKPLEYYRNNMNSLYNVLEGIEVSGIHAFIFSSSCSVYGDVETLPVSEETPLNEVQCPYARTKKHAEEVVRDFMVAFPRHHSVLLRYFNPVGAHPSAHIGETPIEVPNNLVPFITQTAIGRREKLTVFGNDYDTRDGSCIRDYIHVMDIAHAHTLALQKVLSGEISDKVSLLNIGSGNGTTVLEAIKAFEKVSGKPLSYEIGPRRPGDIPAVYANNEKARKVLGWEIQFSLEDMMSSAWAWEQEMKRRAYY